MSAVGARRPIRGLYAVTPEIEDTSSLVHKVHAALSGGAALVQYRNKRASEELKLEHARALKAACAEHGAWLIVNDHVELALTAEADGVHLGKDDGPVTAARDRLGPEKIIGVSCYDELERARDAQRAGADYVAFGSFFPSRVKPGAVRAPIALLELARREIGLPIVAIGGITLDNGGALIDAGADALAVISALFDAADVVVAAAQFTSLFERL